MKSNLFLAAGLAVALAFSASAALAQDRAAADKGSQKFIKNAIQGSLAEIDLGNLAQQKGKSDAVKQYGAMLVRDHGAANDRAKQVASQLGVEPPTGSGVRAKATYLKLKMLSGDTFDRSFVRSMANDHQADIKEFQKEAAKNDAAGAFAKDTLPTLQHHLQEARSMMGDTTTTGQGTSRQ
jgi:putative membrane protein